MTRKEKMELLLSKVAEDKKEEFIAALRETTTKEERTEILKNFGVELTKEEFEAITAEEEGELSDDDLENVAGGCVCICCAHNCARICAR
ncbi:MAG: Nif11-like leader peptide family RiPP precursor [Coriobacteriales bacterium]|nr:Nif11-like leader peptide family RiPP precursor [Coriobacteriales bacterium]